MVLILIPVDMELLVLNVPILLAIATVFASLKDFLQVILLLDCSKSIARTSSLDACHGYALDNHLFPLKEIVCVKTLYNYVDSMLLRLRNIDLPLKVRRRRTTSSIKKNLKHMGRSIDERDSNVDERNEFGHWEIDTVIGSKSKSDNVVLTLVERITRKYISLKITKKHPLLLTKALLT